MKTPLLITLAGTVLGIAGLATYLIVTDRDPVLLIGAIATIIPVLGALFYGQKTVQQTNGTLSAMRTENGGLREENAILRTYLPSSVAVTIPITPTVPSETAIPEKGE